MQQFRPIGLTELTGFAPISNLEWSGALSASAGKGALFSLYLAMHCQPGHEPVRIHSEAENASSDAAALDHLNHYPRAPLGADDAAFQRLLVTGNLINQRDISSVNLWQAMHPDPLSIRNNAKHIPADVIANCSMATQMKLQVASSTTVNADETLLTDIIAGSEQFFAAA